MEILAHIGGLSGIAAILWVLLKLMKGMPWIVMQWLIVVSSAIVYQYVFSI